MALVLLGIFNAVLLLTLLFAFKLIRSGGLSAEDQPQVDAVGSTLDADVSTDAEQIIDLREDVAQSERTTASPVVPALSPLALSQDPAPFPPTAGPHGPLTALSRSAIVVDSSMNGSGPTPSELLFSVIETLGGLGFELTKDSPDYGLLVDGDGHTASVDLTKRPNGIDRISIAVDSPRAVEALAVLEIWHRSRLGATEEVRLSARIR